MSLTVATFAAPSGTGTASRGRGAAEPGTASTAFGAAFDTAVQGHFASGTLGETASRLQPSPAWPDLESDAGMAGPSEEVAGAPAAGAPAAGDAALVEAAAVLRQAPAPLEPVLFGSGGSSSFLPGTEAADVPTEPAEPTKAAAAAPSPPAVPTLPVPPTSIPLPSATAPTGTPPAGTPGADTSAVGPGPVGTAPAGPVPVGTLPAGPDAAHVEQAEPGGSVPGSSAAQPSTAPSAVATAPAVPVLPAALALSGATPAAPAAPAAPGHPVPLLTQIARPLLQLAAGPAGEHVITLSVTPENLGPLTVRAFVGGEGVRVELFAPNDAGREALRHILADLRRDLAGGAAGTASGGSASLTLSDHNTPGDGNAGGGPAGSGNQRDAHSTRLRGPEDPSGSAGAGAARNAPLPSGFPGSVTALDVMA